MQWVTFIIIAVILLAILVIAFPGQLPSLVWQQGATTTTDTETQNGTPAASSFNPAAGARVLEDGKYVTYIYFTGKAFVPQTVVISSGEKVRFVDASSLTMRVGSQTANLSSSYYSSLNEANPKGKGSTYEITLSQPGVWSYQNLPSSQPLITGTVYVR